MEEKKNTDEINLIDIIVAIGRWISTAAKYFVRCMGKVLQLYFRYRIVTAVVVLVALVVAIYFSRPSNRRYRVDGMADLYGVKAEMVKEVGRQLSKSSNQFAETTLENKLGLPDTLVSRLLNIEFFDVIDLKKDSIPDIIDIHGRYERTDTSSVVMNNRVYIRLTTLGVKDVDKIADAILNFINTNATLKEHFNAYREQFHQHIRIVALESKRIDSLARKKYFEENNSPHIQLQNNQLLVGNQQTQLFYGEIMYLEQSRAQSDLILAKAKAPVVVVSGFVIDPVHVNNWKMYVFRALLAALGISLLFAFVAENYKKWLQFLKS